MRGINARRWSVAPMQRKPRVELCAAARPCGGRFHEATVNNREAVNQREADAQATAQPAGAGVGLTEQAEDVRQEPARNAASTVRHGKPGKAGFREKTHSGCRCSCETMASARSRVAQRKPVAARISRVVSGAAGVPRM